MPFAAVVERAGATAPNVKRVSTQMPNSTLLTLRQKQKHMIEVNLNMKMESCLISKYKESESAAAAYLHKGRFQDAQQRGLIAITVQWEDIVRHTQMSH